MILSSGRNNLTSLNVSITLVTILENSWRERPKTLSRLSRNVVLPPRIYRDKESGFFYPRFMSNKSHVLKKSVHQKSPRSESFSETCLHSTRDLDKCLPYCEIERNETSEAKVYDLRINPGKQRKQVSNLNT